VQCHPTLGEEKIHSASKKIKMGERGERANKGEGEEEVESNYENSSGVCVCNIGVAFFRG